MTLLSLAGLRHVQSSSPEHCSLDTIRDYAVHACDHLLEHISKRDADLSDLGYKMEIVKGETRRESKQLYNFEKALQSVASRLTNIVHQTLLPA